MKKKTLGIAIIALSMGFLTSCRDEEKATPTESQVEMDKSPKTTANVNPEHGLPGHRCDLPVGAPLNSSNRQSIGTKSTGSPSSAVSPIRRDQTPEVNPPHGEPGHDCRLPVGAPLR